MEFITVEGIYKDGRIELKQVPHLAVDSRVIVTFIYDPNDTLSKGQRPDVGAKHGMQRQSESDGIETGVLGADGRDTAIQRMLSRMEHGIDFGGEKFNREDIYEERLNELDRRRGR